MIPDLPAVFDEIHRVLKNGGRAIVYLAPIELMTRLFGDPAPTTFTFHTPDQVKRAFHEAGFSQVFHEVAPQNTDLGECVIAVR